MELIVNGHRVTFGEDEKLLSGDGCTTASVY